MREEKKLNAKGAKIAKGKRTQRARELKAARKLKEYEWSMVKLGGMPAWRAGMNQEEARG